MVVKPYTDIYIDFDEDGRFGSGGNVTDDVRYWAVDGGMDVRQNRAAAATLRMELSNPTHEYSPSNPRSSLYPFQLPGPLVRVRSGFPADDFTEASQVALDGHTPTLAGSELGDWSASSGMEIKINSAGTEFTDVGVTSTGTKIATLDYGEANVRVAAEIARPSLDATGGALTYPYKQPLFTLRYVDANNFTYLYLRAVNNSTALLLCIAEVVSGTDTEIESVQIEDNIFGEEIWGPSEQVSDVFATVEAYITGNVCQVAIFQQGAFAHEFTGLTRTGGTRHGIGGAGFTTGTEASVAIAGAGALWTSYGLLTQFIGRVDAVDPQTSRDKKIAFIRAFDEFERLSKFTLFTGTPTPPATAGDIVSRIVTRSEFSRGSIVDDGTTLTPAAASSSQDTIKVMGNDALTELYQVQDDEVGRVYIARNGVLHFEAADHRELNDHDAVISVWLDQASQPKNWVGPMKWDDGKEGVENHIFYEYYRSSKTSNQVVWELQSGDDPEFDFTNRQHPDDSATGIIDIVTIGDSDGVANPKIPVPVTDYSIDEDADGSGQDWLTPIGSEVGTVTMVNGSGGAYTLDDTGQDFTGSTTIAGVSFGKTGAFVVIQDASGNLAIAKTSGDPDGDGTKVNLIKNPEGSGAGLIAVDANFNEANTPLTYDLLPAVAYPLTGFEGNFQFLRFIAQNTIALSSAPTAHVTSAQLKADKLTNSDPSAARAEDSTSQGRYGLRRIQHQAKHIADWDTAVGRAEKRLELRKEARERVGVNMVNSSVGNLMEILYRGVSDRIRIRYDDMGIDRDHYIERYFMEFERDKPIHMQWELTRVVPDLGLNYRYDDSAAKFGTATYAPPDI